MFKEPDTLKCSVEMDPITVELSNAFDYSFDGGSTFTVPDMPTPKGGFKIGLIVGPSGSGKSTLLKRFGVETSPTWEPNKAICSHFASSGDARDRLSAVGLNSIPSWTRPHHVLSTGEKFRADMARRLGDGAVIDEFTSVVDRNVAKSCSYSIRRYADAHDVKGMVFASCHYDIIEWLNPDWVFDTQSGRMATGRLERRPEVFLEVLPCSPEAWATFRHHHYLDSNINRSARCWVATWGGVLVGFASALAFPNRSLRNAWRGHRTVILPDYQGLGLGVRLSDAIGEMFVGNGCRYFSKTSHHRMGEYRERSPLWKGTTTNKRSREDYNDEFAVVETPLFGDVWDSWEVEATVKKTRPNSLGIEDKYKLRHTHRLCYSHEYVGRMVGTVSTNHGQETSVLDLFDP
jgi:GNAT superfamily N-acetyltransferase